MDKRTILAVVLSLAVLFTYQIFFAKPPVPPKVAPVLESKKVGSNTTSTQPAPQLTAATKSVAKQVIAKNEEPPRDIKVETENYSSRFFHQRRRAEIVSAEKISERMYKMREDIFPVIKNLISGAKQPAKENDQ